MGAAEFSFLGGATGARGAALSSNGADSLRAHAEARGLMYGTAVVSQLLDVDESISVM